MNKIMIVGGGYGVLPFITECAAQGIAVEVRKAPPEPEPLRLEFKAPVIKSIEPVGYFIQPNHRPWERKKKGQRR